MGNRPAWRNNLFAMINPELTQNFKSGIKTIIGQLGYILNQVDDEQKAENILLQLKAVKAALNKNTLAILDETYRKVLAEKVSFVSQNCPGNCGNEEKIENLRKIFPEIELEEVTQNLFQAQHVEKRLKKYLSGIDLDTPLPND
jgi:CsoR family transcriptional regulator, copper-sensing transcriptional repressor